MWCWIQASLSSKTGQSDGRAASSRRRRIRDNVSSNCGIMQTSKHSWNTVQLFIHSSGKKKKKNWPRKWLTLSVWVRAWNTRWLTTGPFTTTQLVEYCLNAKEDSELVTKRISISWNLVVNRTHFAGFQFFQKKWRIIIPKYETISQEVDLQS